MLKPVFSSRFKKDLKKYQHHKDILQEFNEVLKLLMNKKELTEKYRDHPLCGNYKGYRECHIKPDVLLVYRIEESILYLARIASHAELF
jgi:mRNA interferase YafQ